MFEALTTLLVIDLGAWIERPMPSETAVFWTPENLRTLVIGSVGFLGFLGVIATLAVNARLARTQHEREVELSRSRHERDLELKRRVVRHALASDLRLLREDLEKNLEILEQNLVEGRNITVFLHEGLVFEDLVKDFGFLTSEEVPAVFKCVAGLKKLRSFFVQSSTASDGFMFTGFKADREKGLMEVHKAAIGEIGRVEKVLANKLAEASRSAKR